MGSEKNLVRTIFILSNQSEKVTIPNLFPDFKVLKKILGAIESKKNVSKRNRPIVVGARRLDLAMKELRNFQ